MGYGSHIVIQGMLVGPLSSHQPRNQAASKYTKHRCLALPLEGMMGCVRGGTQNFSADTGLKGAAGELAKRWGMGEVSKTRCPYWCLMEMEL